MASLTRLMCLLFSLLPTSFLPAFVITSGAPFSAYHQYSRAQRCVKEADDSLNRFQFQVSLFLYTEARDLLKCSKVEDRELSFHIEVGELFCDVYQTHIEDLFPMRVTEIFNKFARNPPPVKIEFDSGGSIHECESFPEAQ